MLALRCATIARMAGFTPDDLLDCYRHGIFPMAQSREDDGFFLVDPTERAIFPLDNFHVPERLARTVRADLYEIAPDSAFAEVIDACAQRPETWINSDLRTLYVELHARGYAHSVEARDKQGALVGGLYGVALGGAFFGESMFSRARDASKVALVHLVARLLVGGFTLLDAQFMTDHLAQFGARIISRARFHERLAKALSRDGDFDKFPANANGAHALQSIAQMS